MDRQTDRWVEGASEELTWPEWARSRCLVKVWGPGPHWRRGTLLKPLVFLGSGVGEVGCQVCIPQWGMEGR